MKGVFGMKREVKGFLMGVFASVLVFAMAFSPLAEGVYKTIKVKEGGINIYVDGALRIPTDANGNRVFPIVYNGTTYLPVRALTGMLTDKNVAWDGSTQSIMIGATSSSGKEVRINEIASVDYNEYLAVGGGAEFVDHAGKPVNAFNAMIETGSYPINSLAVHTVKEYSAVKGKLLLTQEFVKSGKENINLSVYGKVAGQDEYQLVQTFKVTSEKPSVDVSCDISKFDEVSFVLKDGEHTYPKSKNYAFHNIVFVKK